MGPPSDINARVGRGVETWGRVIGRYGEETKNGNGQRLLRWCAMNELLVLNTYLHKVMPKFTWENKRSGLGPIMDYFTSRKVLRQTVVDMKVLRRTEAGSDHYPVLIIVNLKLK